MQTFRELREDGCYYVDKTHYIRPLIDGAKHYFLSRPRRFGKSLFLDTLKELFEGSGELFEGLAIHDGWDWSAHSPVVRLDFSQGDFMAPGYLPGVRVRVQGRGAGRRGGGDGAARGPRVRGQVPFAGRAGPPGRRGVQQRIAQRGGVRARRDVTASAVRQDLGRAPGRQAGELSAGSRSPGNDDKT